MSPSVGSRGKAPGQGVRGRSPPDLSRELFTFPRVNLGRICACRKFFFRIVMYNITNRSYCIYMGAIAVFSTEVHGPT